ncbi:MAG TPA: hypothetical protein ENK31_07985, partial [Nannocystis exedens]|nr:hypothetical protein [Nannocystis exedens]
MASPAQILVELLETVKRIEERQLKQEQRLNAVARQITILGKVLLAPPETPGARGRPKLTPAQVQVENKRRTYRARIGRAAKRYGMTVDEWIERFG